MADEDAPVEDTPAEDAAAEDAPVEDAPEDAAAEEADPIGDSPDAGAEDVAASSQPDDGPSGIRSPRAVARAAVLAAGAVVAGAAAVVGAVWAITAIVDDDDGYRGDCCVVDYATSIDPDKYPEELWGAEKDWRPSPDRDRGERAERRRGERFERKRGERFDRDRGERAERDKRRPGKEHEERYERDGSEPDPADAAAGCTTILSFGTGDDAVTVLVCRAPRAAGPDAGPADDGGYFKFRGLPRDAFRFFPFSDPRSERLPFEGGLWPFGPGMAPWDRDNRPDKPLEDGSPFENRRPFDRDEFREEFERFFENRRPFESRPFESRPFESRPFESDQFFERFLEEFDQFFENGLLFDFESDSEGSIEDFFEDFFRGGERGFRFRGDDEDGSQGNFCFRDGDEEQCFGDLGQLSDEEREQLERIMEMLDGFGLEGFLGRLLGSLDGLEFELPESRTDPAGGTGA